MERRHRRLRHVLPEIRIVPEEEACAATLQSLESVERGQHLLAVIDEARQAAFAQGSAEVAGVAGDHDLTRLGPHLQRLMAGRMAVGRDADHGAIAEQVVLALDLLHWMPMIEVGAEEADPPGHLGILRRLPFALLHDHRGVGHQLVATGMVEMQMRVHDEVDLAGIPVDRFEA